jgi:hypothetical protein
MKAMIALAMKQAPPAMPTPIPILVLVVRPDGAGDAVGVPLAVDEVLPVVESVFDVVAEVLADEDATTIVAGETGKAVISAVLG